jgi:hypothetical protein
MKGEVIAAQQRGKIWRTAMSDYSGLGALVGEIREASQNIADADARTDRRLDGIEKSINELYLKTSRPAGYSGDCDGEVSERKSAVEMCRTKHALDVPKIETTEYVPGSAYIDEAITARRPCGR